MCLLVVENLVGTPVALRNSYGAKTRGLSLILKSQNYLNFALTLFCSIFAPIGKY